MRQTDSRERYQLSEELASLRFQLDEERENLRLVDERIAQYVLDTDVPLGLIKERRRLADSIAALESKIAELLKRLTELDRPIVRRRRFWRRLAFVATGLCVVIVLVLGVWLRTRIVPLPKGFNVGVAQFVEIDPNGQSIVTQVSRDISDRLARSLQAAPANGGELDNFLAPADLGPVIGAAAEERDKRAAALAGQHNVTVLISGVVTPTEDGNYLVEPNFYINDTGSAYGAEIRGPSRLGEAVSYQPASDPADLNLELMGRFKVIVSVVYGLRDLYYQKFDRANVEFGQALIDWSGQHGREVIYLLRGADLATTV